MAMEGKNIVKKSGVYLIGNLTTKIMASLLLPIYAVYVTAAELGSYDMVVTVCSIITPLVFCCLWEAVLRFVLKETSEGRIKEYVTSIISFLALIGIVGGFGGFFIQKIFDIEYNNYYYIIAYVIATGGAQVFQALTRATKHNRIYVVAGISSTAVNFLLVLLFVCKMRLGTFGLIAASVFGQLTIIAIDCIGIKIWKYVAIGSFNSKLLSHMIIFSFPLILNQVIMWLINGFSKVVINIHIGVEANGLYSFANKFSTLVTTLGSVVAMALFEEAVLASNSNKFGEQYGKAVSNLNKVFYALITVAFPAIMIFYQIFAGNEYMMSKYLVPVLLIYSIMMNFATNLGSVFQVIDKTKYQFVTTLLGAIGSCGLSYLLVFKYDMYGVVVGQLIGSLILVLSRIVFIMKHVKIQIDYKMILSYMVLFIIVVVLAINSNIVINIGLFIAVCCMELLINKELVHQFLAKITKKIS